MYLYLHCDRIGIVIFDDFWVKDSDQFTGVVITEKQKLLSTFVITMIVLL